MFERRRENLTVGEVEPPGAWSTAPGGSCTTCSRFGRPSEPHQRVGVDQRGTHKLTLLRNTRGKFGGLQPARPASRGAVPVSIQIASVNCSAASRFSSGPRKTYPSPISFARAPPSTGRRWRGCDVLHQLLQVVAVFGEVHGEVVEQVFAPRLVAHHVHRVNDPAAHQSVPDAVHHRSGKSPVVGVRDQRGELFELASPSARWRRSAPAQETETSAPPSRRSACRTGGPTAACRR